MLMLGAFWLGGATALYYFYALDTDSFCQSRYAGQVGKEDEYHAQVSLPSINPTLEYKHTLTMKPTTRMQLFEPDCLGSA